MTRVSRGEGRVMLSLFTHIPPLFFLTLNASLVASTHSRHTARQHSTALLNSFRILTLLPHAFNSAFLTSSHICPLPALSGCFCTPIRFNAKYCLPCFTYLRLALFVVRNYQPHLLSLCKYQIISKVFVSPLLPHALTSCQPTIDASHTLQALRFHFRHCQPCNASKLKTYSAFLTLPKLITIINYHTQLVWV